MRRRNSPMADTTYSFGELVVFHRHRRSSYTELASKCGVSRRTLSRWSHLSSAPRSLEALRFLEWMQEEHEQIERQLEENGRDMERNIESIAADLAAFSEALEAARKESICRCGRVAEDGDRYCARCGVSLLVAEDQVALGCPVCDEARLEMSGGMMVTCPVCWRTFAAIPEVRRG
jgi:transcriptional regulator with XRE-family HTH domain